MEKKEYRQVTTEHINHVRLLLLRCIQGLADRADMHDATKLQSPEMETFIKYTPKLQNSIYGSQEYKEFLKGMGPALKHHYANNRHHAEYFSHGMRGMNLLDLVEMFCDWIAAVKRHKTGNIRKSIELNQKRFKYSDDLKKIFENTVEIFEEKEKKCVV